MISKQHQKRIKGVTADLSDWQQERFLAQFIFIVNLGRTQGMDYDFDTDERREQLKSFLRSINNVIEKLDSIHLSVRIEIDNKIIDTPDLNYSLWNEQTPFEEAKEPYPLQSFREDLMRQRSAVEQIRKKRLSKKGKRANNFYWELWLAKAYLRYGGTISANSKSKIGDLIYILRECVGIESKIDKGLSRQIQEIQKELNTKS